MIHLQMASECFPKVTINNQYMRKILTNYGKCKSNLLHDTEVKTNDNMNIIKPES